MRVYVAHPIAHGDQFDNVRNAIHTADVLIEMGHTPFVPHLNVLWQMITGRSDIKLWLNWDTIWISQCECLIRIDRDTPSKGCDHEEKYAREKGIPVFHSIKELEEYAIALENGQTELG